MFKPPETLMLRSENHRPSEQTQLLLPGQTIQFYAFLWEKISRAISVSIKFSKVPCPQPA